MKGSQKSDQAEKYTSELCLSLKSTFEQVKKEKKTVIKKKSISVKKKE